MCIMLVNVLCPFPHKSIDFKLQAHSSQSKETMCFHFFNVTLPVLVFKVKKEHFKCNNKSSDKINTLLKKRNQSLFSLLKVLFIQIKSKEN